MSSCHKILVLLLCTVCASCEEKPTEVAQADPLPTPTPANPSPPASAPAEAPAQAAVKAPPESVAAQHILIAYRGAKRAPKSVRRSRAEAEKLAQEIQSKAASGTSFDELVQQYSDDEASKARRGSLGKFKKGVMDPAFEQAAFKLEVNQVSDVVKTPFGFHIIKRNQ